MILYLAVICVSAKTSFINLDDFILLFGCEAFMFILPFSFTNYNYIIIVIMVYYLTTNEFINRVHGGWYCVQVL